MRNRFLVVVAGVALMLAGTGFGGGGSAAQAMTCTAQPPVDTACDTIGAALALVCAGRLPSSPEIPVETAAVAWPISCPGLG